LQPLASPPMADTGGGDAETGERGIGEREHLTNDLVPLRRAR
jgi:hypothetical protein